MENRRSCREEADRGTRTRRLVHRPGSDAPAAWSCGLTRWLRETLAALASSLVETPATGRRRLVPLLLVARRPADGVVGARVRFTRI